MKEFLFKALQWRARTAVQIDGFFFSIRLKYLQMRYGKDLKAMPKEVNLLGVMSPREIQVIAYASVLKALCEHYRLEVMETRVGQLYAKAIHGRFESIEESQTLDELIFSNKTPALNTYLFMLENGEITENKKRFYGAPPPYSCVEEWLAALDSKYKA